MHRLMRTWMHSGIIYFRYGRQSMLLSRGCRQDYSQTTIKYELFNLNLSQTAAFQVEWVKIRKGYTLMAPDFVPMAINCSLGSKAKALGWWGKPCSTVWVIKGEKKKNTQFIFAEDKQRKKQFRFMFFSSFALLEEEGKEGEFLL